MEGYGKVLKEEGGLVFGVIFSYCGIVISHSHQKRIVCLWACFCYINNHKYKERHKNINTLHYIFPINVA